MTKLDAELLRQLHSLKTEGTRDSSTPHPTRVLLKYTGDLDAIKAHGFKVQTVLGQVVVGVVDLADLEKLAALDNVVHIEAEQYRRLHLKDSVPEINAPQVWAEVPSITGNGVIVGVVDSGIDIFHKSFLTPDGKSTRILFLWDQTLTPQGTEKSPATQLTGGATWGVEFSDSDINAALGTPDKPCRSVDLVGHGTHVAGTAAGNGSQSGDCHLSNTYVGVAPQASLIVVKTIAGPNEYAIIPSASPYTVTVANVSAWASNNWVAYYKGFTALKLVTANPAEGEFTVAAGVYTFNAADAGKAILINYIGNPGVSKVSNVNYLTGVQYIFNRALNPGPGKAAMPAVVNLSIGGELGAHDGTSNEETTLDGFIAAPATGKAIVVAAGNDGGKDGTDPHTKANYGLHAAGPIFSKASRTLTFIVQPKDYGTETLDLWYSGGGVLSCTLSAPSGGPGPGPSVTADAAHPNINQALGTDTVSITWSTNNSLNQKNEIKIIITPPPPTPPVAPATTAAPSAIQTGNWQIVLQETAGANVDFDCWIEIERENPGAYFSPLDQDSTHTITVPGSATNVITVGAYDPRDSSLAAFSGRGPTPGTATVTPQQKPDICGPGVGIFAPKAGQRSESCCCDCCVDFYAPRDGTSMGAPHVAGVAALMFQRAPTATHTDIKAHIQSTARIPPSIPELPNNDWGFGQIDAFEAVHAIGSLNPLPNGAPKVGLLGSVGGPHASSLSGRGPAAAKHDTLPLAAMWSTYLPTPKRLHELFSHLQADPMGQLLAILGSNHFDEVYRLVNTNRRVATCWHRMHGPMLIREFARPIEEKNAPLFPERIEGDSLSPGLERTLAMLSRYGSPKLRADIDRYAPMLMALPGMTVGEVGRLSEHAPPERRSPEHTFPERALSEHGLPKHPWLEPTIGSPEAPLSQR
jgi:subtilisin family serine protease